jgi:hypothetical protein
MTQLTDNQLIKLNESYMEFPDSDPSSEMFGNIVDWAESIGPDTDEDDINLVLLNLSLKGLVAVGWDPDVDEPMFAPTEKGRNHPQLVGFSK